jgi:hypothetical protein
MVTPEERDSAHEGLYQIYIKPSSSNGWNTVWHYHSLETFQDALKKLNIIDLAAEELLETLAEQGEKTITKELPQQTAAEFGWPKSSINVDKILTR